MTRSNSTAIEAPCFLKLIIYINMPYCQRERTTRKPITIIRIYMTSSSKIRGTKSLRVRKTRWKISLENLCVNSWFHSIQWILECRGQNFERLIHRKTYTWHTVQQTIPGGVCWSFLLVSVGWVPGISMFILILSFCIQLSFWLNWWDPHHFIKWTREIVTII